MELLIGVLIGFFIQSIIKAGWRFLNPLRPVPPQPPRTRAQWANEAAHDEFQATTPRVVSMRLQRRTRRGRPRLQMEDGGNNVED